MKKFFLVSLTILFSYLLWTDGVQPEGSGTDADPYQIATLQNLEWLSTTPSSWDSHFIQTKHINALSTCMWNEGKGITPIGTSLQSPFTGSYDGQHFVITGLTCTYEDESYLGMFGIACGALLESIRIQDIKVTGRSFVGGLVGSLINDSFISNCSVQNCYSGSINGLIYVGGLIGDSEDSIIQSSFSDADVDGGDFIGGFIGKNNSQISNCYSLGEVSAENIAGGFAGENLTNDLQNCYSIGQVDAISNYGGLIGQSDGTNINNFWNTETSLQCSSAGGTGKTTLEMTDITTFTDTTTSGLSLPWDFIGNPGDDQENEDQWSIDSECNTGYPYLSWQSFGDQLQPSCFVNEPLFSYVDTPLEVIQTDFGNATYWEWDFDFDGMPDSYDEIPNWAYTEPGSYTTSLMLSNGAIVLAYVLINCLEIYEQEGIVPTGSGTVTEPYEIASLENLRWLSTNPDNWSYHYIQTANIDASDTENWTNGTGFRPIGISNKIFQGSYDGHNFSIDGLFIDRSTTSAFITNQYTGLFGNAYQSKIQNLTLTNVNITGESYTGGIIGSLKDSESLANCHVSGNVTGNESTGGIAGYLSNTHVSNSSFNGTITGNVHVGGLIGNYYDQIEMNDLVSIQNCSSIGEVIGAGRTGGLIGRFDSGNIENCFSNVNILSTYGAVGGFIGNGGDGLINNCYSRGQVSGINYVGGFLGSSHNIYYSNCFSHSDVLATWGAGGFIGISGADTLAYCYSCGTVSGETEVGGLVGLDPYNLSISLASFWDTETSAQSSSTLGTGLTTAEMTSQQTFLDAGWDFVDETENGTEDFWAINPTLISGYPYLFSMEPEVSLEDDEVPQVKNLELKNYPNPFNPETYISFNADSFKDVESVQVEIYNIKGQKVNYLNVDLASQKSSVKTVKWQGDDNSGKSVSSGVYFYKLLINNKTEAVKKCLLLK